MLLVSVCCYIYQEGGKEEGGKLQGLHCRKQSQREVVLHVHSRGNSIFCSIRREGGRQVLSPYNTVVTTKPLLYKSSTVLVFPIAANRIYTHSHWDICAAWSVRQLIFTCSWHQLQVQNDLWTLSIAFLYSFSSTCFCCQWCKFELLLMKWYSTSILA